MNRLLIYLAIAGSFIAAIFRGNAHKAKAEQAEERADQAEAGRDNLQGINTALHELETKHQQENRDAETARQADHRNGLDNHW